MLFYLSFLSLYFLTQEINLKESRQLNADVPDPKADCSASMHQKLSTLVSCTRITDPLLKFVKIKNIPSRIRSLKYWCVI